MSEEETWNLILKIRKGLLFWNVKWVVVGLPFGIYLERILPADFNFYLFLLIALPWAIGGGVFKLERMGLRCLKCRKTGTIDIPLFRFDKAVCDNCNRVYRAPGLALEATPVLMRDLKRND